MRKILLSLAVAFGMQAVAQNMDSVMFLHNTDNTVDTVLISSLDSITFGYINSFNQGGMGNIILPGNATCDSQYISVAGCGGLTTLVYNGYTYDLVEIGGQCWFKENLQTSTYRDGTPINYPGTDNTAWANDTTGAYAWIDNDSTTYDSVYGKLYNWYAVDNSTGLCPTDWHVPTDCEWMYLEGTLGMSTADQEYISWRGTDEGGKLRETGTTHWDSPNTGATNSSGFTGLPGGYSHQSGSYGGIGGNGYWWSSSQASSILSRIRVLHYNSGKVRRDTDNKGYGYSVRCLRD
jgi:uncharacterized protein (TIGR02145 family)